MEREQKLSAFVLCLLTALIVYIAQPQSIAQAAEQGAAPQVEELAKEPPKPEWTLEGARGVVFSDLPAESAAHDAAGYLSLRGIMAGVGEDAFAPHSYVDRATAAALLQRLSSDIPAEDNGAVMTFSDVEEGQWYYDSVLWAAGQGIVNGYEDGTFRPKDRVDRGEFAIMLRRCAKALGADTEITGSLQVYRDGEFLPEYRAEALSWVTGAGIYDAVVGRSLMDQLPLSRGQCAQALTAFLAFVEGEETAAEIASGSKLERLESASEANHAALQEAIDAAAQKYGAVGVQVAVIEDGQVTDTFASGWATKGSDPMTADHKMRIASISKVVLGMETMLQYEQGVVDLDDSIGAYWGVKAANPYYPEKAVNVRSLLSHTSSVSNLGDDASRSYSAVRSRLTGSGYSRMIPGDISSWSYNNYAFGVLGQTVELAAGEKVDTLLRRDLLDIMDVDGAFAAGDLQDNSNLVTLVYHGGGLARSADAQRSIHTKEAAATGTFFAGGYTVSSADLGKLIALLANDGVYEGLQLMKPETVALMETYDPQILSDDSYQALPMRYKSDIYGRNGVYFHTGSAYGVYNCASYDPETGDGVVVLTVGANPVKDERNIYAICGEINGAVYEITK